MHVSLQWICCRCSGVRKSVINHPEASRRRKAGRMTPAGCPLQNRSGTANSTSTQRATGRRRGRPAEFLCHRFMLMRVMSRHVGSRKNAEIFPGRPQCRLLRVRCGAGCDVGFRKTKRRLRTGGAALRNHSPQAAVGSGTPTSGGRAGQAWRGRGPAGSRRPVREPGTTGRESHRPEYPWYEHSCTSLRQTGWRLVPA